MRKITKSLILLAASAMAFASCAKEEAPVSTPIEGSIRVRFVADAALTKVGLNPNDGDTEFTASWDDNDQIAITSFVSDGAMKETKGASWSGKYFSTEFKASDYAQGSYDFVGVWPVGKDADKLFPAERHQNGAKYNGEYDIMKSSRTNSATLSENATIVLNMVRQTSIAYFHITSALNEKIVSATLTTDQPIASSNATLDYTGFEPNVKTSGVNSIKLIIDGEEMSSSDFKLWFNVLSVEYETMTLRVETENHSFSLEKKTRGEWKAGELNKVVIKNVPAEKWAEIEKPTGETTETLTMTNKTATDGIIEFANDNITATFNKNSGTNPPAWNSGDNGIRLYAQGTATVSAKTGYVLKSVKFNAIVNENNKHVKPTPKINSTPVDESNISWTGDATEVVLLADGTAGNIAISSIEVTYSDPNAGTDPIYKYSVMADPEIENGTVEISPASAAAGATVTLTPAPDEGYELVTGSLKATNAVSGEELTLEDNKFTMPAANVNVTAAFTELPKYAVNLVQTTGGTISSDIEQAWEGQTVTLSNEITEGYTFKSWDVKYGPENTQITVTDNKFTMPAAAVTASANFIPSLTVTPMSPTKKDSPAGSWNFTVTTAATDWEVSVPDNQDWASVEKTDDGFTLTYTANEKETETTEDRSVEITVSSEQAEKIGVNAIKITFSQSGKEYIAPGTGYNLVTNTSDLYAGMTIVLGCAANNKVAGTISSDYLTSVDANIENGVLTSNNAVEFTLGGAEGAWTLTSTEGMLGVTAVKKLSYSASNRTTTWTISINEGIASITSTTGSYGTFKYNAQNPRFTTYASGQVDIQIYAKEDGLSNRNLAFTSTSDTKDIKNGTSVDVLDLTGVTDGTKTYDSSDKTVATITNDGKITLLGEGTTKISVSIPKNETYRAGYAEYTLTVNDTRAECATPTAKPASGEVEKGTTVALSCSTANSTIYYREGTTGDFSQYTSPIEIDAAKTIEAYATADGYKQSSTAKFEYTVSGGSKDTIVLNEEFDNNQSTDSNTVITSSTFDNFSGETSKAYKSKYGGIKLGASGAPGYITSKSLDLSKPFTISINVLKYGSDTGKVTIEVGNQKKEITPTDTDTKSEIEFYAATSSSTVKISTTSKRAYIDNVVITRHD